MSGFLLSGFPDPVRVDLLEAVRLRPLPDRSDVEVGVALARLLHDDLEAYGTRGGERMDDAQCRLAVQALQHVTERLGLEFRLPFRDFTSFRTWWMQYDAYGSWQARRDLLGGLFDVLRDRLAERELAQMRSSLASPVSPHGRTGWPAVDSEIEEMRRHFAVERTPQDHRAVGLGCVAITEAISATVYRHDMHGHSGEAEPPVAKTKQRIEAFVASAAPGPKNAALRKLVRAVIEFAQEVKHSNTPTRRDAGVAADAVILVANVLRRLSDTGG